MFKKMKLSKRIFLGYTLPVILFILLPVIVYINVKTLSDSYLDVEFYLTKVMDADDLSIGASKMVRAARGYLIDRKEVYIKTYENGRGLFHDNLAELEKTVVVPEQRERLARVKDLGGRIEQIAERVIGLVKKGEMKAPGELAGSDETREFITELDKIINEFNSKERQLLSEEEKHVADTLRTLIFMIIAGTLLLASFSLGAAFFTSKWIMRTIEEAVNSISSAAAEIAATVNEHEKTANLQAASANETSASMEQLSSSSRQVTDQAESAATGMRHVLALSQEGAGTIKTTLEGMELTKKKTDAVAGQILSLSEQTAQIATVTNLVSDLANQTNLLALNAAVEAAHAGEHGRGFAVVAAEIRKLADQSKKSAEKIQALVASIQKATDSTVMATEESNKTVEEGANLAQKTVEAFNGVNASINSSFENFKQISLNITQQAAAISQVVAAMNAISAGARETAAGIGQTKIGISRLNETASGLKEIV